MKRIGLALSGGGYRATLYSLGSLIRLNEFGLLPKIDCITSVSGGAITAGYLAYKWDVLNFDSSGIATNFDDEVRNPLLNFCSKTIDKPAFLKGMLNPFTTVGEEICKYYDKYLYKNALLSKTATKDNAPEFIYYGTNYDTGVSVRITKDYLRDYRIGKATGHQLSLSKAVGISSAFPPVFSPIILNGKNWVWTKTKYDNFIEDNAVREKLYLCDGGLYDNLGIEKLWKVEGNDVYDVVFVADSGAPLQVPFEYTNSVFGKTKKIFRWRNRKISQFLRMSDIMINQQRALRKRQLMSNFVDIHKPEQQCNNKQCNIKKLRGAYWGIDTNINNYPKIESLLNYEEKFQLLAGLPTQLCPFSDEDRNLLINWAYALTDAALRSRYDNKLPDDGDLPF